MSNLKDRLIRLGSENPELRKHLKPVIDKIAGSVEDHSDEVFGEIERNLNLPSEMSIRGTEMQSGLRGKIPVLVIDGPATSFSISLRDKYFIIEPEDDAENQMGGILDQHSKYFSGKQEGGRFVYDVGEKSLEGFKRTGADLASDFTEFARATGGSRTYG
jgi:hypothetical protein